MLLLAEGSIGEAVRDLQQNLSALGYPLATDGIFGKDTEAAVRAFQRDHGLGADGIAGPKTLAAIGRALPFGAAGGGWWRRMWQWVRGWFGRPAS
jgi:peptidoglycan hydrolase-like protein with peptidoglycan-binding domain